MNIENRNSVKCAYAIATCVGARPRDENAAAGEGKIERARRKVEKCGTIRFDCRDGGRTR